MGDFPYAINGLAMGYNEVDGAVKVVLEAETKEIIGIHIVGANATELVGEAVMALQLECTVDELAHTIRVHPTFSEALMDAGRDAAGWALYLPPNAKKELHNKTFVRDGMMLFLIIRHQPTHVVHLEVFASSIMHDEI